MALRRASIAERFFRPARRLEAFRSRLTDPSRIQYLESSEWQAADLRAIAPSNWPYSANPLRRKGPPRWCGAVAALQKQGKLPDAVRLLRSGRETFLSPGATSRIGSASSSTCPREERGAGRARVRANADRHSVEARAAGRSLFTSARCTARWTASPRRGPRFRSTCRAQRGARTRRLFPLRTLRGRHSRRSKADLRARIAMTRSSFPAPLGLTSPPPQLRPH